MATGDASRQARLRQIIYNEPHHNPLYYNKHTTTDTLFRVAWLEHQKEQHDTIFNERLIVLWKLKKKLDALDRRFEYLDAQENLLYQKAMEVYKDFDPSPSTSSGGERSQEPTTSNKSAKITEPDHLSLGVEDISIQDEPDISASTTSDTIDSDFEILVTDIDELLREMAAEEELELCSITTGDELASIEELELSGNTSDDEIAKEESGITTGNEMNKEDLESSSTTTWDEISKEEELDLSSATTGNDSTNITVPDSVKQEEEKKDVVKVSKSRKASWPLLKMKDDLPCRFSPPPKDIRRRPKGQKSFLDRRYRINPIFDYKMDLFTKFLEDEAANVPPINQGSQSDAGPSSDVQNDEAVTEKVPLKMAVWDKNPMDFEKITILHMALRNKEKQLSRICKFRPEFRSVRKANCLHVTCEDTFSADWVKRTLDGLKLWEDIQLEIKEQGPTAPLAAILHAKLSEANTPAEAIALLQSQNPKLNVLEWKVYHVVYKKYMNYIYFVVPESTLGLLEQTKHWVNFGDTNTYVQVNNKDVMVVPVKPSKKPTLQGTIGTGYF